MQDTKEIKLVHSVENAHLCAACVIIFSLLCQSVASLDPPPNVADAPSSLRISSLVALLIYSAPRLRGFSLVDHRLFGALLITTLALYGGQNGGIETRTGDTIYISVVLLCALRVYASGGIEHDNVRPDSYENKNSVARRDSVSALCSGILFYVGVRGFRQCYTASANVESFEATHPFYNDTARSPGYAHFSSVATVPLAFGYGICISIAMLMGLKSNAEFEVGVTSMVAIVAALWSTLGGWEHFDALLSLYSEGACSAPVKACNEAFRARRFAMLNSGASPLWVAALGVCVYSFDPQRRLDYVFESRSEKRWKKNGFTFGLIALGASLLSVWFVTEIEGSQWYTDLLVMSSLLGVFVSFFSDPLTGTVIYSASSVYEEIKLAENYGISNVYVHFTHVTIAFSIFLITLHAFLTTIKELLRCYGYHSIKNDHALAIVATFGASLTFGLYLASSLLLSGTNGFFIEEQLRDNSGKRTLLAFVNNHFVPFFAWLPLYACRCEVQILTNQARSIAWMLSLPLVLCVYYVALLLLGESAPALDVVDMAPSVSAGIVGLIAWTSAAFV